MHRSLLLLTGIMTVLALSPLRAEPLPETKALTREGDLAAQMVEGIDKCLNGEGGILALDGSAVDERIQSTEVSGY